MKPLLSLNPFNDKVELLTDYEIVATKQGHRIRATRPKIDVTDQIAQINAGLCPCCESAKNPQYSMLSAPTC